MTRIAWHQFTISFLAKYDLEIGVSSIGLLQDIWVIQDLKKTARVVDGGSGMRGEFGHSLPCSRAGQGGSMPGNQLPRYSHIFRVI